MPGYALAYGIFMLYLHRACRLFSDGLPYQTQGRLKNSIPPGQISLSDYRMNTQKLIGYALGPLGSAAASAIALPLISWYFSAEDIGRIVLLQTVAGMVLLVMGLGLDQAYIREYHAAENKPALFKNIFILPLALIIAACVALFFKLELPAQWILNLSAPSLGLLCIIFIFTTFITRYLSTILRMQERAYAFSLSQLIPKILILLLILLYIFFNLPKTTFNLILAYALAQALTVAVLALQTRSEVCQAMRSSMSLPLMRETLRYGLPLAFGGLAYWGLASIDRFLLKQLADLSELGVYSMAVSFGAVALIFQSIFSTIWAPMVFKWVKEGVNLNKISGIVDVMLALCVAILCLIGLFSPLVPLLLPEKYAPVQFILLSSILFPLLYTLTEVTSIGINVSKRTWLITVFSLLALLCNLGLLYLLIPKLGARGAAMATAASFWLFFVMKTEASLRLWQPLPRLKVYGITFLCLIVCLAYTYAGNRDNYFAFAGVWLITLAWLGLHHKQGLRHIFAALSGRLKQR